MPIYEFRCKECGEVFEERRPMSRADDKAVCSSGHQATVRMLPVFASIGRAEASPLTACGSPSPGSCGSGCACQAN